jgi:hypothetical protein
LTRSLSARAGLELMGSTSIIPGEAGVPTSPTAPPAPASTARGGLAILESATSGEVAFFSAAPDGGVAVRASSVNDSATTLGSGDLVREGEAERPGRTVALLPTCTTAPRQDRHSQHGNNK